MTKGKTFRVVMIGFLVLLFIGLTATSIFFFIQYQKAVAKDPSVEITSLTKKISKFMDLPSEQPQLATVTDSEKLKTSGFQKVENGDQILFFAQSGQAIVYRPSTSRVVEVLPIRVNQQSATASAQTVTDSTTTQKPVEDITPASSKELSVTLYNGTATKGLSTKAETDLTQKFDNMSVADRASAAKSDYQRTLIVDLTGSHSVEAKQLATLFKGDLSELPPGEAKPDSDLLVILGNSFVEKNSSVQPTPSPTQIP